MAKDINLKYVVLQVLLGRTFSQVDAECIHQFKSICAEFSWASSASG